MDLLKRQLYQKIKIISILFLLMACNEKVAEQKEPVLECLLEKFISTFNLNPNDIIYVSDYQGWSENTSNILFNVESKDNSIDLSTSNTLYAKIDNYDVYLVLGNLEKKPVDSSKIISNNIKWQKIESAKNNNHIPNENPVDGIELQLVYNSSKKVIEKILKVSNPNSSNKDINYEIFKKCGQ